ncbi:MAG TPA: ribonuclease III domain-containing protein [Haloplasmataceae bacterium]
MDRIALLNGLTLAYIGDSYYELKIREYLIESGYTKVNELHKLAIKYVRAASQARLIDELLAQNYLTDVEKEMVKRGRNAKINHTRQNVDILTYKHSTSFETLIGYLYLSGQNQRLDEIVRLSIKIIESWKLNE